MQADYSPSNWFEGHVNSSLARSPGIMWASGNRPLFLGRRRWAWNYEVMNQQRSAHQLLLPKSRSLFKRIYLSIPCFPTLQAAGFPTSRLHSTMRPICKEVGESAMIPSCKDKTDYWTALPVLWKYTISKCLACKNRSWVCLRGEPLTGTFACK